MDEQEYYNIPSNFIDQGRILNGMFRTRYFIEGIILALFAGGTVFLLTDGRTVTSRIVWIIFSAGPVFFLGVSGIGGYPLSTNIINFKNWTNGKKQMTYDFSLKPLKESPLDAMENTETRGDKLLDAYSEYKKKREAGMDNALLHTADEIEFAQDEDLKGLLLYEEKTEKKSILRKRNGNSEKAESSSDPEPLPEETIELNLGENAIQELEGDILF